MIRNLIIGRSIKDEFENYEGKMVEENKQWWEGLGKELEIDIETLEE